MITQEYIKSRLRYDSLTGLFFWIKGARSVFAGRRAGCLNKRGYRVIRIKGKLLMAHRLVWLYMHGDWPQGNIDHINHIRDDNRLENLRDATCGENSRNSSPPEKGSSGVLGVTWKDRDKSWYASISYENKTEHLGSFRDLLSAVCARKSAELRYGFHENHGRSTKVRKYESRWD